MNSNEPVPSNPVSAESLPAAEANSRVKHMKYQAGLLLYVLSGLASSYALGVVDPLEHNLQLAPEGGVMRRPDPTQMYKTRIRVLEKQIKDQNSELENLRMSREHPTKQ